jgi:hypothetical protein
MAMEFQSVTPSLVKSLSPSLVWFTPRDSIDDVTEREGAILCLEVMPADLGSGLAWLRRVAALRPRRDDLGPNVVVACPSAKLGWRQRDAIRRDVAFYGASLFEAESPEGLRSELEDWFVNLYRLTGSSNVAPPLGEKGAEFRKQSTETTRRLTDDQFSAASDGMKVKLERSAAREVGKTVGTGLGLIARALK